MATQAHTHYLPFFVRRDADGREQAVCGTYVTATELAPEGRTPTCWGCALWLHEVDRPTRSADERARVLARITEATPYGEPWEERTA
jgi:hypothetical protein